MTLRLPLEAYCYAESIHLLAVMELYGGVIMDFMAKLMGDFMKSIHVCAHLHYK